MSKIVKYPNRLPTQDSLPRIYRQTHKICKYNGCDSCVSSYSHQYCIYCCDPNTKEYRYHFENHVLEEEFSDSDLE